MFKDQSLYCLHIKKVIFLSFRVQVAPELCERVQVGVFTCFSQCMNPVPERLEKINWVKKCAGVQEKRRTQCSDPQYQFKNEQPENPCSQAAIIQNKRSMKTHGSAD